MSGGSRILLGVALCLLVVAAAQGLARAGLLEAVAPWAVFLLCPLMHLGMMFFMGRGCHQGHNQGDRRKDSEPAGAQAGDGEV